MEYSYLAAAPGRFRLCRKTNHRSRSGSVVLSPPALRRRELERGDFSDNAECSESRKPVRQNGDLCLLRVGWPIGAIVCVTTPPLVESIA
jgi:hypothetical protein